MKWCDETALSRGSVEGPLPVTGQQYVVPPHTPSISSQYQVSKRSTKAAHGVAKRRVHVESRDACLERCNGYKVLGRSGVFFAQSRLGPPPPAARTLGKGSDPAEERRATEPAATKMRRTSVKRMRAKEL